MGTSIRTACSCAPGSVKLPQFMGVKEADLSLRNFMDDGPMVPHGPAQTDYDSPFAAAMKEQDHLVPEFVKRCLRQILIGYTSIRNEVAHHIAKNAAYGYQADPLGKHHAQLLGLFKILQYLSKQLLRLRIPDAGYDPRGVYDAVYGAQAIKASLFIWCHNLCILF